MAHLQLRQTAGFLAQEGIPGVALERPRVVLRGAEVDAFEGLRAMAAEERIVEFGVAVIRAEEQVEGVFGVDGGARIAAAQAYAGIDLEFTGAIGVLGRGRIDPLQRNRAFPGHAPAVGVGVKPLRAIDVEIVGQIRGDDHTGQREQGVFHRGGAAEIRVVVIDDFRVHAKVQHLVGAGTGRPATGRTAGGLLQNDISGKQIGLGVHIRRLPAGEKGGGPQIGGGGNREGAGRDAAMGGGWRAAIGGVTNGGPGRRG